MQKSSLDGNAEQSSHCKNMNGVLLLQQWKTANQIKQPSPKSTGSQCMHGNAFTMDTFLSFHILSTTRGSGTRNKHRGIAQKIRRRGEQEAAMILRPVLPPLVVSKEGSRGGITGGEPGCNIRIGVTCTIEIVYNILSLMIISSHPLHIGLQNTSPNAPSRRRCSVQMAQSHGKNPYLPHLPIEKEKTPKQCSETSEAHGHSKPN